MNNKITIMPSPVTASPTRKPAKPYQGVQGAGFDSILDAQLQKPAVKFSQHANLRLEKRGIEITSDQSSRLNQAVKQVGNKGGRDSLVMLDNLAMIVSVKNQTVVTVVEQENLQENVFTNIDSAVIA